MSDSVRSHRWQPSRLCRPWDSPGKNTGVGCHFLLQCMKVKRESEVAQSSPILHNPMDCSLPGSSIHGIFQARVLEWGAIAFSINLSSKMIKTLEMDEINQIIWYLTLHIPYIIIWTRGHYKNVSEIFYVLFKNLPVFKVWWLSYITSHV